jgi:hypothetical protein
MSEKFFNYKKQENYYDKSASNSFPVNLYISNTFGCAPVCFSCDDIFDEGALIFLKNNSLLVSYTCNGKIESVTDFINDTRGGSFLFFYKNVFVNISRKHHDDGDDHFYSDSVSKSLNQKNLDKKKLYNIHFKGPVDSVFPIKDFTPFIHKSKDPQINIFVKNSYGEYNFEPLTVKLPKNLNLDLNYGKNFSTISNNIIKKLKKSECGLFMFHGPSGTGKSTFIKYLSTKVNRDFIYIPNTMLETFTTDPTCLQMLIQKSNSVLVLEDAEKLILKRHGDSLDTSGVSTILNLSDGIMGDILNISIIITYNCNATDIDPALRRKGRMKINYKFDLLSKNDAIDLAKKLNYPDSLIEKQITDSMSLADIYNLNDINSYEVDDKPDKKMGF